MIRTFATLCRTSLPASLPLAARCDQSKTLLLSHVTLVLSAKCYVTILFTQSSSCPLLPHVIHHPTLCLRCHPLRRKKRTLITLCCPSTFSKMLRHQLMNPLLFMFRFHVIHLFSHINCSFLTCA